MPTSSSKLTTILFTVYITKTHEALGALLATVTVTTDLQRTVVGLSLRGNPLKLYRAKHTYHDTGFYIG